MCQQSCSSESYLICRKSISREDLDEEQRILSEASSLSVERTDPEMCQRLEQVVNQLNSLRRRYCGDLAKCTCHEPVLEHAVKQCNIKCEILYLNSHELVNAALIQTESLMILGGHILWWYLTNYISNL
uniref:AAI domain-containing protein n=1 Tax=Heterorhabditis bacteriophora TaxID=37862 RepID=A0A1I7W8S4_HETBA